MNSTEQKYQTLYRPEDVARLSHVGRTTVFRWLRLGLPCIRVGRIVRIPASDLNNWLHAQSRIGSGLSEEE